MTEDIIQPQHKWMSLASVVDMTCAELGLSVPHNFQWFLNIAKWELIQLKLDRDQQPKTVLLPVSDVFTVQLPPDAIDVVKVGIQTGQFIQTIGLNSELSRLDRTAETSTFPYSVSPGWLPNGISATDYVPGFVFMNYGGLAMPAIAGGLPHEGHYAIRRSSTGIELLLDGNLSCSELYVEYLALGVACCGETILDAYIADYIKKCMLFTYESRRNPEKTEASIMRLGREKFHAFTLVSGRTNSVDRDTMLLLTRRNYRLTPHA